VDVLAIREVVRCWRRRSWVRAEGLSERVDGEEDWAGEGERAVVMVVGAEAAEEGSRRWMGEVG
jgi:hypothetical protein